MSTIHNQSFKKQAVEKALSRANGITQNEIVNELGIGISTLQRWIKDARDNKLEGIKGGGRLSTHNEKRPQDWSLEERLEIVLACASLDEEERNKYCRKQGIYSHHVTQWKKGFASGSSSNDKAVARQAMKSLKSENKALRKELNRKDKALAETAALLVLQKKVRAIWGSEEDEDSSL